MRKHGIGIRGQIVFLVLIAVLLATAGCQERDTEYEALDKQEKQYERKLVLLEQKAHKKPHTAPLSEGDSLHKPQTAGATTPKPPSVIKRKKPTKVAGIYISGYVAGNMKRMKQFIKLLNETELNTVVIDIKNDSGHLTYDSKLSLAQQIGADRRRYIKDLPGLIRTLKKNNIYVIGRLVTFKDPFLAASRKDFAMKRKDNGGIWRDRSGIVWVDPYNERVRQYNLDIAKEVTTLGVDEIQFDYVRFPDNGKAVDRTVHFQNKEGITKAELIQKFLTDARDQLHPLGAALSADVFGLTTSTQDDMGIGQSWVKIAAVVDYISPMVYPSHYSRGIYGIQNPDLSPSAIVKRAIKDGLAKNKTIRHSKPAQIRPWYQAFTATWVKPHQRYGQTQIREQIVAAKQQGVESYLLWNPNCKYEISR